MNTVHDDMRVFLQYFKHNLLCICESKTVCNRSYRQRLWGN